MTQFPSYLTITEEPAKVLDGLIKKWAPDKVAFLVDENTKKYCLPLVGAENASVFEIKSGERNKNLHTCQYVWTQLTEQSFTRKSLLVNLGGGVIGDMGGFIASTYKRGIRFVNIPTTLLSQVDASIGGKLGVDFEDFKNHIGIFREPDHVIVNTSFLRTLPEREIKSGFAEIIKHSLIADREQWDFLTNKSFEEMDWDVIIPKSIAIKQHVVASDPLEKGYRKILNFGHTMGHAIESYFLKTESPLLHGEAIAIGMILESKLSSHMNWITQEELESIVSYISGIYSLSISLPLLEEIQTLLFQDKKNDEKGISFSLISSIGECEYDVRITNEMIGESLGYYKELNEQIT